MGCVTKKRNRVCHKAHDASGNATVTNGREHRRGGAASHDWIHSALCGYAANQRTPGGRPSEWITLQWTDLLTMNRTGLCSMATAPVASCYFEMPFPGGIRTRAALLNRQHNVLRPCIRNTTPHGACANACSDT